MLFKCLVENLKTLLGQGDNCWSQLEDEDFYYKYYKFPQNEHVNL